MSAQPANPNPLIHKLMLLAAAGTLVALVAPASAQRYQRTDGDPIAEEFPYDIQQTMDSGCVVVGEVIIPDVGSDMYVSKHDKDGNVMWTLRYGTPERDAAYSVQETMNGEFIIAGHTEEGPLGLALLKLDPMGNPIWARTYRGDVFGEILLPVLDGIPPQVAVRESMTGDIIAVANTQTIVGGQAGIFLRTDPAGMPLVNVAYLDAFGGDFVFDGFSDLKEAPDGTIVITGFRGLGIDPPFVGATDILTMRIQPFGAPMWSHHYGHPDPARNEVGRGIDFEPMNGEIIVGAGIDEPDGLFATEHLWMDGGGGTAGLLIPHITKNMLPAYSATRMYHGVEVATAGRDYGFGGTGIAGQAAVVTLPPMIPGVLDLWLYGPTTPLGAKGLTPMDLTCGYAVTGPEPSPDGFGLDQWIAKSNDAADTGCFQERVPPFEEIPPIEFFPFEYMPDDDLQSRDWGEPLFYQTNPFVLCHSPVCVCLIDFNNDGVLNLTDVTMFINFFLSGNMAADLNNDGFLNLADIQLFIHLFQIGC